MIKLEGLSVRPRVPRCHNDAVHYDIFRLELNRLPEVKVFLLRTFFT